MTPKQRVLKLFPRAELDRDGWSTALGFFDYAVFKDSMDIIGIGQGANAAHAWADAARRLK